MFNAVWTTVFGETIKTAITVQFIHYKSNEVMDKSEIPQEYLPEDFASKQYSVYADGKEWVIIRAEPCHALQYSIDKKLKLWIKDPIAAMFEKKEYHPAETGIFFGTATPDRK